MLQVRTQEEIHQKGFSMVESQEDITSYAKAAEDHTNFAKMKVGAQTLEDAVLDLGIFKKTHREYGDKRFVLQALAKKDYRTLREISNYFYETSGIYERACKYFAFLYRYDWYVVPYVDEESASSDKILSELAKVLRYLDSSNIKKLCGDIALKIIVNGCYYGYIVDTANGMTVQDLPINYCRSRFCHGSSPAVEFNMAFFDDNFADIQYRMQVLNMFPPEFKTGYLLYKKGKLFDDSVGMAGTSSGRSLYHSRAGWYLLDPSCAFKMNVNGSDYPMLANAIPNILDLDEAQELDRRKTMQKLLKIIIQKLPLDKNSDLVFDVDEAKDIHNNAVAMLKRAVGVDVMTTFADVDVADLADKNTATTQDDLQKIERQLYNAFGISGNLFNTDGNLSLEKSILNDESSMRNLILQFSDLLNGIINRKFPNRKRYSFRAIFLETTVYNYQDLAKMYKEQVQIGYSKMLPQIAMGQSQSAILAMAHFENDILHLYNVMIPPLMSSTMSSESILNLEQGSGTSTSPAPVPVADTSSANKGQSNNTSEKKKIGEEKEMGRPEKKDSEKSEKTIQNRESMS